MQGAADPLVLLLAATLLLFVLVPRGDVSGLWSETLCCGAYGNMPGVSVQEGDGVRAIEALALADAVCLDKAGTLTENSPRLTAVVAGVSRGGSSQPSALSFLPPAALIAPNHIITSRIA